MKALLLTAGGFALVAVLCGAFGAHGLKEHLTAEQLDSWNTGVRYQMWHALALIGLAWLRGLSPGQLVTACGRCFIAGTVLFSGSIYLLSTRDLIGLSTYPWLGPITPLGGLLLIIGWSLFIAAAARMDESSA